MSFEKIVTMLEEGGVYAVTYHKKIKSVTIEVMVTETGVLPEDDLWKYMVENSTKIYEGGTWYYVMDTWTEFDEYRQISWYLV